LRLTETPMKGGIVELPARDAFLYMLRAADHGKPTVVSHATFDSPLVGVIRDLTSKGPVSDIFMDLLESIPASYLVVHRTTLTNSEALDVNNFVVKHLFSRRLKYIATYDNVNDLYSVVKTEPAAKRETP
jgi:hypothetical protein